LELDNRLKSLDENLWWVPRDTFSKVKRLQERLKKAKAKIEACEIDVAEARHKAYSYRWIPFLGGHWQNNLKLRQQKLTAAKSEAKWLIYCIDKQRTKVEGREMWLRMFSNSYRARAELRDEREARIEELGREKLRKLGEDRPSRDAVRREGERELRRRLAEERNHGRDHGYQQ